MNFSDMTEDLILLLNRSAARRLQMELAQAREAAEEAERRAARAEANAARLEDDLTAARAALERAQNGAAADRCFVNWFLKHPQPSSLPLQ